MRASHRLSAVVVVFAVLGFGLPSRADSGSGITVEAPSPCAAGDLVTRVSQALVGPRARELEASVVVEALQDAGYRAVIKTMRGAITVGSAEVTVPTCEEALDAAVVVLAVALSEPALTGLAEPAAGKPADPLPSKMRPLGGVPTDPRADSVEPVRDPADENRALGVSVLTGLDVGTLPVSTAYVGVGLARALGRAELRGSVRYGLPHLEVTEGGNGQSESTRSDFGILDLDVCYGAGADWRVAACAGAELGAVRRVHTRAESELDLDTDVVEPRLAGVLTALMGYRSGSVQPELELSAAAVGVGRQDGTPWASLRAGFGVGMRF